MLPEQHCARFTKFVKRWFPPLALILLAAFSAGWSSDVQTTVEWNSNVSNANAAADRIDAVALRADANGSVRYSLGTNDAITPAIHVGVDAWPQFAELTSVVSGFGVTWERKLGLGPFVPIVSAAAAADRINVHNSDLSGGRYTGTIGIRKRWEETTQYAAKVEFARRESRDAVYRGQSTTLTLIVDHDLSDRVRLELTPYWRTGAVVSYATPPRPDLVALAPNRDSVETFGRPMVAYGIEARSYGSVAALVYSLGDAASLSLAYELRETNRASIRYGNQLVSVSFVRQF